jgi:DeoR family fructose operon transcriptional repressor
MTYELRKKAILSALEDNEVVDVLAIAHTLKVSAITIRRDLDKLAAEGQLKRTHGGAIKNSHTPLISFEAKSIQNAQAKTDICRKASELINDGETIFIDCGSTTFGLCQFIQDKKINVITNSLPVFNALINSNIELSLIGGAYNRKRMAVHGEMAVEQIKKYYADKAFIGVDGITIEHGLMSNTEYESSISKAMIENCTDAIVLVDESKLGKRAYYSFTDISDIDTVISNNQSDLKNFQAAGIKTLF